MGVVLVIAYLCMTPICLSYLIHWNDTIYSFSYSDTKQYRYAIVMGGFGFMNRQTGEIGFTTPPKQNRLWKAVELWKEGRVKQILITGDMVANYKADGSCDKELFLAYMEREHTVPREAFVFEQHSGNTYENALYTAAILDSVGVKGSDCLLVTTAKHIPRSLYSFRAQGYYRMAYCGVDVRQPLPFEWSLLVPSKLSIQLLKELGSEWIGIVYYKWKY